MIYRASRLLGLVNGSIESTRPDDGSDEYRCKVRFTLDEAFFKGHFPGHPVVPGLIMLEGLVALVEKCTDSRRILSHVEEAKFRSEAKPNDELTYVVKRREQGYSADVFCGERDVLNARIRLANVDQAADLR